MHDWDVGSVLTLILGLTATVGLFIALVWTFANGR